MEMRAPCSSLTVYHILAPFTTKKQRAIARPPCLRPLLRGAPRLPQTPSKVVRILFGEAALHGHARIGAECVLQRAHPGAAAQSIPARKAVFLCKAVFLRKAVSHSSFPSWHSAWPWRPCSWTRPCCSPCRNSYVPSYFPPFGPHRKESGLFRPLQMPLYGRCRSTSPCFAPQSGQTFHASLEVCMNPHSPQIQMTGCSAV